MPSIRDIAKAASVSPSTVSLVVKKSADVSEAMRRRVEAVIEQLAYTPARPGRPVRKTTSRAVRVGVVYARRTLAGEQLCQITREWLNGIRDHCVRHDVTLDLLSGLDSVENDTFFRQTLDAKEFQALLLLGVQADDGYLASALAGGLPVLVMNRTPRFREFSSVSVDNYGAGRLVGRHLADLGHRRAWIVTGPSAESYPLARLQGARDGFAAAGMSVVGETTLDPSATDDSTFDAACQQIATSDATACYVLGDSIAERLVARLEAAGIRVPERLSVVGFDDSAPATGRGQKLTSVSYDRPAMGRQLADMALRLLDRPGKFTSLCATFQVSLNDGTTTAAPFQKDAPRKSDVIQ